VKCSHTVLAESGTPVATHLRQSNPDCVSFAAHTLPANDTPLQSYGAGGIAGGFTSHEK